MKSDMNCDIAATFIARWEPSGGKELANYQSFLIELCALLGVAPPEPTTADDRRNAYVFERAVPSVKLEDGGVCRIDLYKRGCFILETKQGVHRTVSGDPFLKAAKPTRSGHAICGTGGWDLAMYKAKEQAEGYARGLPADEGRPPFLVVVDVGHCIELYNEFSCTGGIYRPFPDSASYRISLNDLANPDIRERLRLLWSDPLSLDPSRHSARVTRELVVKLADLAKSLEFSGHTSDEVSEFLMRCLFTFFAEDIGLLPLGCFTELLESLRGCEDMFPETIRDVWNAMRDGGKSVALKKQLLHFNGGLFEKADALPVNKAQLELLIEAAKADWSHVEPAIFGTLLERALNPTERHHLGAHYTPRDYVERLVLPTVIEPLTTEWEAVKSKAVAHLVKEQKDAAIKLLKAFHHKLCGIWVLDPACGSGNFLYVTFEHLKRLEGEILTFLDDLGEHAMLDMESITVNPHQLLGIEVNTRAAGITDMVLWIGYLQWHYRTRGNVAPPTPVIKKFHNVECRDAVLAWDSVEPLLDDNGEAISRWDGVSFKKHPTTGENVPDESARTAQYRYINPRPALWPQADYVVGNPPFIGNKRMRLALGDGYVEALRKVWTDVPDSADFVMYWWQQAAVLTRQGALQRFGFITTNSLIQEFNRRVIEQHLNPPPNLPLERGGTKPLQIAFAIPDHPWVDSADGAAVRIAMTVATAAKEGENGVLVNVISEQEGTGEGTSVELNIRRGLIHADLTTGANVAATVPLKANDGISNRGMIPHGEAFLVTEEEACRFGTDAPLRPYRNGRDLTSKPRGVLVIDTFGYTESDLQSKYPEVWQWLYERARPEREQNKRASIRERWWLFAEPRKVLRAAHVGIPRYIATVQTAKHRFFVFLDAAILPDDKLIAIASDDAFIHGVLSSRAHIVWSLATGGHLGVGNDPIYNKSKCFDAFPFPVCDIVAATGRSPLHETIRTIAESLDAHRKRQQSLHPDLGLTDMYNVLEKVREIENSLPFKGRAGEGMGLAGGAENPPHPHPDLPLEGEGTKTLTAKERIIHDKGLLSILRQLHEDLDAAVFAAYGWPSDLTDEEILEKLVALNQERAAEEKQGIIRWLRPEYQNPDEVAKFFTKAKPAAIAKLLEDLVEPEGLAKKSGDGGYMIL